MANDPSENIKSFGLLSLNTFGIPFYLAMIRLARLTRVLKQHPVNVVCFQEIQQNAYIPLLVRELQDLYPFYAFAPRRLAPKGGLLTLSGTVFEDSDFTSYQDRGSMLSLGFADWALHKGVLRTQVNFGDHSLVILNTHLHANYLGNWSRSNPLTRIQHNQIQHLARLVQAESPETLIVVCGDFNFPRHTFLYEELISRSGLFDPFAEDPRPTYIPFPLVPSHWNTTLDYLLIRFPDSGSVDVHPDILFMKDQGALWPHQRFLSDHCALVIQVTWDFDTHARNSEEHHKSDPSYKEE